MPPNTMRVSNRQAVSWPLSVPFDQYQRYRIASEIALQLPRDGSTSALRVLDVGGHFLDLQSTHQRPIRDFLPDATTFTVDVTSASIPGYALARGEALPFADRSFDVVTSLDMLEHVAPELRAAVVRELMRVSKRLVVLAAPFRDDRVSRAEQIFAEFIRRTWGIDQAQLKEHSDYGLPELDTVRRTFDDSGWATTTIGYGNLWRWLFMMIDKHTLGVLQGSRAVHIRLDERFNHDVFEHDREPPHYRRFIVASVVTADPILSFAEERFGSPTANQRARSADEWLFELAEMHAINQDIQAKSEPERRDAHVAEVEAHRAEMYRHIAAKDAYIQKLEQMLKDVERSVPFRLSAAIRKLLSK